jgi:hypothetical protein
MSIEEELKKEGFKLVWNEYGEDTYQKGDFMVQVTNRWERNVIRTWRLESNIKLIDAPYEIKDVIEDLKKVGYEPK